MNLLTQKWLPVRLLDGGSITWIGLSELLTTEKQYEICLPRDDLEMAALQLVICITQVLFTPEDLNALVDRLRTPMTLQEYNEKIERYKDWFDLEHPEHPFMQVRGVSTNKQTPMYRLMPGLADATNSYFVNEPSIADDLCGGCAAIAIFNRAANAPSFGGGFIPGLRGGIPITTLIHGKHSREMVWLNILTRDYLNDYFGQDYDSDTDKPTWVSKIKRASSIESHSIGVLRGLLWQPVLVELGKPVMKSICDLCGRENIPVYDHFFTNRFKYTVKGTWPHPHSPTYIEKHRHQNKKTHASFKSSAPSWTDLARFIVKQEVSDSNRAGQEPASVISQARRLYRNKEKMVLAVGGYCNEPRKIASIADRRHETLRLNCGWQNDPRYIVEIVKIGLDFKSALTSALEYFDKGKKNIKRKRDTHKGLKLSIKRKKYAQLGEAQFYRRTENLIQKVIAEAHFDEPELLAAELDRLRCDLKQHCDNIFKEQTDPYLVDPELIRTMAIAKRILNKKSRALITDFKGGE